MVDDYTAAQAAETLYTTGTANKQHLLRDCRKLKDGTDVTAHDVSAFPPAHVDLCSYCRRHSDYTDPPDAVGLSLPADLERFADNFDQMHKPGVYTLELRRPANPGCAWDKAFDVRPEWFSRFRTAPTVLYVGAAGDVLQRLEQHRDGKHTPTLLEICDVRDLLDVAWFADADRAFERERGIADHTRREHPGAFVHQR